MNLRVWYNTFLFDLILLTIIARSEDELTIKPGDVVVPLINNFLLL